MSTISNVIKTILLLTIFSSSFAEVQEVDSLQYDNESHESIISPTDPDLKWQKYLLEKGMRYRCGAMTMHWRNGMWRIKPVQ